MLRLLAGVLLSARLAGAQQPQQAQESPPGGVGSPSPEEQTLSLDNFKDCGLISRFAPNKIPKDCFQSVNNVVLDNDWTIRRRSGYTAYNPTACAGGQAIRGVWPFFGTDGSQYLIVYSSSNMSSSKGDGTCSPITGLTGNLSTTAQMDCVQTQGYLWCTNGTDPVFRTNVTSTQTVTQAPTGSLIGAFRNRIVIGNVSGNLTNVYLSGELNGLDFTLPAITYSTSPVILNIAGTNDGQNVSCLMGEFQNQYLIGRNYDLYGITGYDTRDFSVHQISNQIGCIDEKSVQEVNNVKYWLSRRGVEAYTGTEITRASYPIDPTIKAIVSATGFTQSLVVNANNFTQGNLSASGSQSKVNTAIVPGNLVVSTAGFSDNTTASFSSGSVINNLSTGVPNVLMENITTGTVVGGNFNSNPWTCGGTFGSNPCSSGTSGCCTTNETNGCPNGATHCARLCKSGGVWRGHLLNASSNSQIYTYTINANGNGVAIQMYNLATSSIVAFQVQDKESGPDVSITENPPTPVGWTLTYDQTVTTNYNCTNCTAGSSGGGLCSDLRIANVRISSYPPTATYVSQVFNTGLSTPIISGFNVVLSSNAQSALTFQEATSADNVTWSTTTIVPGQISAAHKQYWRYEADYTTTSGTMTASNLGLGSLIARTTAYYISPCITAAGNTAWGNLTADAVTNGGSFTFWMSTSATSCAQVIDPAKANWTAQTPNSIIGVPISSYTAVRVLFSIDAATEAPIINDFAVNWNQGGQRPPVASSRYNDEYWLFYTSSTAVGAYNDHAAVYDQNRHWVLYDDINAYSAAIYLNTLYTGDSTATGLIYQQDISQADNGGNFTMSFQTADLDGGDPLARKEFHNLYLVVGAQTVLNANLSIACNYFLDGSTAAYSLGSYAMSESLDTTGYGVAKFAFPVGQAHTGHWVSVACANTGNSGPINIYGLKLVYKKKSWD